MQQVCVSYVILGGHHHYVRVWVFGTHNPQRRSEGRVSNPRLVSPCDEAG